MACLLTCVGTITNQLFESDFKTTKQCQFFSDRGKMPHPFVFLRSSENAASPLYWDVKDRKKILDDLELLLLQEVFITEANANVHSLLKASDPILPKLPRIHDEICLTERQKEKKAKKTWTEDENDSDKEPPAKRRTALDIKVSFLKSSFELF
jgi:hypothetical protein